MTARQLAILILILTVIRAVFYIFPNAEKLNENVKRRIIKYIDIVIVVDVAALLIVYLLSRITDSTVPVKILRFGRPVFNVVTVLSVRIVMSVLMQIPPFDVRFKRIFIEYVDSIVVAGITALFIIQFLFRTFYIPSGSMLPTLKIKDYIIVNEFIYRLKEPDRGEIIVFKPPPEANAGDKEFIKRVIGLPGETISVKNGKVYINNDPLEEPYLEYPPDYYFRPRKIPDGCLFVMGDNRPSSADSHVWGFLPKKNIVGKASLIVLPPNRIRLLK